MHSNTLLTQALTENHLTLNEQAQQSLLQYLNLLTTWNKVFNLTSITHPREMIYLHLIDSLIVNPYIQGHRLLDVGSGAGLPGIPLAIINPHRHWVLLDKNSKKTRFLTQVVADLQLNNVEIAHSRCEDFHPIARFDSILSRAFSTLALFAKTNAHLLHPDGILLAMKGKYPEDELAALPDGIVASSIHPLALAGMPMERHIVCLKKSNN